MGGSEAPLVGEMCAWLLWQWGRTKSSALIPVKVCWNCSKGMSASQWCIQG